MKKIDYNAPVTLSFFIVSLCVLILGYVTSGWTTDMFFSIYRTSQVDLLILPRFFLHVIGHVDLNHFFNNMLLLLVLGPPLEEKYGSIVLLGGIAFTAFVSGVLHFLFFPGISLLGASGIVFMFILLASLSGMRDGKIPLTLILVALMYLGQEVYSILFLTDNVAHCMHIIGGICGTCFGFSVKNKNI